MVLRVAGWRARDRNNDVPHRIHVTGKLLGRRLRLALRGEDDGSVTRDHGLDDPPAVPTGDRVERDREVVGKGGHQGRLSAWCPVQLSKPFVSALLKTFDH